MLNKIKVIGMFLFPKKEQLEEIKDVNSVSQETENEVEKSSSEFETKEEHNGESWLSFKLMTWTPSGSKTVLKCTAKGKIVERIKNEISQDEVIEVQGYLRNENIGLQVKVKVVEFSKLNLDFEKIDKSSCNQVRLLGKIINDLQPSLNRWNEEVLSFKLVVPREGVRLPLFFCRVNDRADEKPLIPELKEKTKRGDVIIVEGFLQTKKEEAVKDGETKIEKISSVNCYGFTFLDSDSVSTFRPLNNLTRIVKEIKVRKW